MAQWKKVIVSGSNAELAQVTASVGINISADITGGSTSEPVLVIASDGNIKSIPQADIAGTDTDTTYDISSVTNGSSVDLRLTATGDGSGYNDVTFTPGTGITISQTSDIITIANSIVDSGDTTYDGGTGITIDVNNTASTDADQSHVTTVGALDAGSITSGFGSINNGSNNITTAGTISGSTVQAQSLTVNGDAALTGNLVFNGIQFLQTSVVTHTGSNSFGTANASPVNTQTFYGDISASGQLQLGTALAVTEGGTGQTSLGDVSLSDFDNTTSNFSTTTGTVTSITPGTGFDSSTAITTSGTLNIADLTTAEIATGTLITSGETFGSSDATIPTAGAVFTYVNSLGLGGGTVVDLVGGDGITITGTSTLNPTASLDTTLTTVTSILNDDLAIGTADGTEKLDFASPGFVKIKTGGSTRLSVTDATTTISNDLSVTGNLTVVGTTTSINTETINLADNFIVLNSDIDNNTAMVDSGITIRGGNTDNQTLYFDANKSRWSLHTGDDPTGDITVKSHIMTVIATGSVPTGNPDWGNDADSRKGQMAVHGDDIYICV